MIEQLNEDGDDEKDEEEGNGNERGKKSQNLKILLYVWIKYFLKMFVER